VQEFLQVERLVDDWHSFLAENVLLLAHVLPGGGTQDDWDGTGGRIPPQVLHKEQPIVLSVDLGVQDIRSGRRCATSLKFSKEIKER